MQDLQAWEKHTARPPKRCKTVETTLAFGLLYTDVGGPFKPQAKDGSRFCNEFEDHTRDGKRSTRSHQRVKRLAPDRALSSRLRIPLGLRVQKLRCAKGEEYIANYYRNFWMESGIQTEFAAATTFQQIGMPGLDGSSIMKTTRCIVTDRGLPTFL